MMTPQQLKSSILQRAIEGKLVEQRPEEGTAKELLKQIKAEKDRLVKEGKIKKTKPLPPITEDEIPFELPESWEWVRISNVCWLIVDCPHSTPKYEQNMTDYFAIDTNCIDENGNITKWRYVNGEDYETRVKRLVPKMGDIVLTREGSIGRAAILPGGVNICLGQRVMLLRPAIVDVNYLRWFLMAPDTLMRLTVQQKGLGAKHINVSDICNIEVPLPPLQEQYRIVVKIEELLPLVDEYDKSYSQLMALNEKFPQDMKKSILQYAIEGKLVEQRPEEGTAADLLKQIKAEKAKLIKEGKIKKEKPLPPITEDEIPFDIPESWEWCRLGDLSALITKGTTPKGGKSAYVDSGVGFLRAENIAGFDCLDLTGLKYVTEENHNGYLRRSIVEAKDFLITIAGTLGRTGIVEENQLPLNANQAISIVRLLDCSKINLKYLVYVVNSPMLHEVLIKQKKITAIPNLTLEIINNMIIPLPPLAEQKRVVERIEQLLPLCDELVLDEG